MRHSVRVLVQLAIGQPPLGKHHRRGIRGPLHLLLEQSVDALLRIVRACVVPVGQQLTSLHVAQERQAGKRHFWIGDYASKQRLEVFQHALDRGRLKQVTIVLHRADQSARCAIEGQVQVARRRPHIDVDDTGIEAGDGHFRRRVIERQHDVIQRSRRPPRMRLCAQPCDRQMRMIVRGERERADPGQQLAERRVVGEIGAQHHEVGEATNRWLEVWSRPAGDEGGHGDVVLAAVAAEQCLERRQQGHEERGALLLAETLEGRRKIRRHATPHLRPLEARRA